MKAIRIPTAKQAAVRSRKTEARRTLAREKALREKVKEHFQSELAGIQYSIKENIDAGHFSAEYLAPTTLGYHEERRLCFDLQTRLLKLGYKIEDERNGAFSIYWDEA